MRLRPIELAILAPLAIAAVAVPSAAVPATPAEVAAAAATAFVADAGTGHDFAPAAMPAKTAGLAAIEAPLEEQARTLGTGIASYYGKRFAGRPTASGERFNPQHLTAAHRTLPFGSKVRVTNPDNGKSVVVRINDRGPFTRGRTIDLSRKAAEEIGLVRRGHGPVELALLD